MNDFTDPYQIPSDGAHFSWNGKPLEPLTLRRQVVLSALKQHLPAAEIIRPGDYLGQACIVLWLCSHEKQEIDALSRHSSPLSVVMDWADDNIRNTQRADAIKTALEIWEDANSEGVTAKSEGSTPGKPENQEAIPDGTAAS